MLRTGTGEIKFPLSDIPSSTNYLASKVLFYGTRRVGSRHATADLGPSHVSHVRLISIILLHLVAGKNSHSGLLQYILETGSLRVIAARHFDSKNGRVVGVGLNVRLISLKRSDFAALFLHTKDVLLKYLSIFYINPTI